MYCDFNAYSCFASYFNCVVLRYISESSTAYSLPVLSTYHRFSAPTTLSPLSLKKIWCRLNYTSWSAPVVQGCSDPFHSTCSEVSPSLSFGFITQLCKKYCQFVRIKSFVKTFTFRFSNLLCSNIY